MKILVTGHSGFIGSHLTHALNLAGHSVAGIDIAPMELSQPVFPALGFDIRDAAGMEYCRERLDADACVHLAAIASPPIAAKHPAVAWATNVQGTHNVLQLCQRIGCKRVIFMSSAHVYGISPKYMPTDENHPLALHDLYTTTKIMGEQLCRLFYENHGLSYTVLRLFNAYGPGQSSDYFIGAKLKQAREGNLTLRNGGVTKDWVHVSDVCRAIMSAIESDYVGALNVGTGQETSLAGIVDLIAEANHVDVVNENVPPEGPTRMCADWRRAKQTLGWEPQVAFKDGLAELIEQSRKVAA